MKKAIASLHTFRELNLLQFQRQSEDLPGGVELDMKGFKSPVMLSATDGVGTKLMVAQKLKKFDTLGIDLTAMCVNDLAVCGAWPLSFLDYIGCGSLNEEIMKEVIKGIVNGCEQAECILAGGRNR